MTEMEGIVGTLRTVANQVNTMHQAWPEVLGTLRAQREQQQEHERRIKQLEQREINMNTPIIITKLLIFGVVIGGILLAVVLGKIPHEQGIQDVTILSSVLIGALGLKAAADAVNNGSTTKTAIAAVTAATTALDAATAASTSASALTLPPDPITTPDTAAARKGAA